MFFGEIRSVSKRRHRQTRTQHKRTDKTYIQTDRKTGGTSQTDTRHITDRHADRQIARTGCGVEDGNGPSGAPEINDGVEGNNHKADREGKHRIHKEDGDPDRQAGVSKDRCVRVTLALPTACTGMECEDTWLAANIGKGWICVCVCVFVCVFVCVCVCANQQKKKTKQNKTPPFFVIGRHTFRKQLRRRTRTMRTMASRKVWIKATTTASTNFPIRMVGLNTRKC